MSGDAHMLAVDDGSHTPGGFPVMHASPLDKKGSIKGGPYVEYSLIMKIQGSETFTLAYLEWKVSH